MKALMSIVVLVVNAYLLGFLITYCIPIFIFFMGGAFFFEAIKKAMNRDYQRAWSDFVGAVVYLVLSVAIFLFIYNFKAILAWFH